MSSIISGDALRNRIKSLTKAQVLVIATMVVCCLLIWPVGIIGDELISRTAADYSKNTGPIGDPDTMVYQEFIPAHGRLKSLGLDIGKADGNQEGIVTYHIKDLGLNDIAAFDIPVADMKDGELTDIPVNISLTPGERYFIGVDCRDYGQAAPVVHYRSKTMNAPPENLNFYYGLSPIEDATANIRYTYEIPLSKRQILFYYSFIILAGVTIMSLIRNYSDNKKRTA